VEATEAQGRPALVSFSRVSEGDVQDDLDSRAMELSNHRLEFVNLSAGLGRIALFGREEGGSVVAPVIPQQRSRRRIDAADRRFVELLDRQQLDGRDAQLAEIGDLLNQPNIRPGMLDGRRPADGEPAQVRFIDNRLVPGPAWPADALPIETSIEQECLRGIPTMRFRRGLADRQPGIERHSCEAPCVRCADGGRIEIYEKPTTIETMAFGWRPRSVDAVGVGLSPSNAADHDVPDVACPVRVRIERNGRTRGHALCVIEHQELDALRVAAEDRKVNAVAAIMNPDRERPSRANPEGRRSRLACARFD
jgi:hypothetical protein